MKFNDADLIGWPVQIVVGKRGLKEGKVEMKLRRTGEKKEVALDALAEMMGFARRASATTFSTVPALELSPPFSGRATDSPIDEGPWIASHVPGSFSYSRRMDASRAEWTRAARQKAQNPQAILGI